MIGGSCLWALDVATVLGAAGRDLPGPLHPLSQQTVLNTSSYTCDGQKRTYVLVPTIAVAVEGLRSLEDNDVEAVDPTSVWSSLLL